MNSQPRFQSLRTEVLSRTGQVPRELPRELPATRSVCSRRLCVPQLLAAVADTSPESVALSLGGLRMTYGQLNAQADRLAANLRSLGVGPEVPVAVCLERSFEYVVSALAVWKAGGAYLPLDSSWPAERCAAIIDDAGAPVLISRSVMLRSGMGAEVPFVVNLDSHSLHSAPAHTPFPSLGNNAETKRDQLAYISYTSGTTGTPKGVEITHGNLLNLVFWHRRAFGITASDRTSHLAGLAFDAAVWELWPHLSAGATVVLLADDNVRMSPRHLRDWIARERITVAFVPTTLAEPLIDTSWPKDTALRYLLTGSDALHRYPSDGLPFTLVNNYGPTECTVVATSGLVTPTEHASTLPCIGTGIANTPIYLLDEQLQPVAPGEIGEIFIGGTNVGRGYRNQPDLTAQRFLRDPFRVATDARMYRSGDLGSKLPSGQIQFHGRVDHQQKIRGHRVEPDEVASVLARHSGIGSCAVIGYGDVSDRKLAAYFVPQPGMRPEPAELREFLTRQLPDFMIPAAFVRLDALPLNSSGKLDRAALPIPSTEQAQGEFLYRAPQSPHERQVAGIVAELLQLKRVGLDDNYFLLGGHSLLGTQLVLRARERFGVELTLRHLFEAQTVAKLAAEIERLVIARLENMPEEEAARLLATLDGSPDAAARASA
jgi:amino acid adenylation domain-containing protein